MKSGVEKIMRQYFGKVALIITVLLLAAVIFFGYTYAMKNLESFLLKTSRENFAAELSIGKISIRFPLCLELRDIRINDSADIKSMQIYPSPASFLLKKAFIISMIKFTDPVIKIDKGRGRGAGISNLNDAIEKITAPEISAMDVYIRRLYIHNGTLIFTAGKNNTFEFIRIKGIIESPGFYFSKNKDYLFRLAGFLKNRESDFLSPSMITGRIREDRVIDAEFRTSDVKINTLGDIYTKYLERFAGEGRLNFDSHMQISKSDMKMKCSFVGGDVHAPLRASFFLLFNFKNNIVKIENIEGNLFNLILDQS